MKSWTLFLTTKQSTGACVVVRGLREDLGMARLGENINK